MARRSPREALTRRSSYGTRNRQGAGPYQGHTDGLISVAFSPDGKTLASATGGEHDQTLGRGTGKERAALEGRTLGTMLSVAFSPDGKTLAAGAWDTTIKLWDVASWKRADGPPRACG